MTKFSELHKKWMQDSEFRREYEKLDEEFKVFKAGLESAYAAARGCCAETCGLGTHRRAA